MELSIRTRNTVMPNLKSLPPAPQMRQLDYFVGHFRCQGLVLDTPFSLRHRFSRTLDGRMELDGHWFLMRIDEAETTEHTQPVRGIWQITFDRNAACFVSLWTDNMGRWAEQRSRGWDGNSLAFTGAALVNQRPGAVRDTLVRNTADEMRFLVDFEIEGSWSRFLELTCVRSGH